MSGTVTRINRTPADCGTEAVGRAAGRIHGGIADPGSTESPHVVRPVPESR